MVLDQFYYKHVKLVQRHAGAEATLGNPRVACLYCDHEFVGGPPRIRAHLLGVAGGVKGCKQASQEVVDEMRHAQAALEKKRKADTIDLVQASSSMSSKRSSWVQSSMPTALNKANRDSVDKKVASFFYENGIAFNVARSTAFKEMIAAVGAFGGSYKAPACEQVRTKLLGNAVTDTISALSTLHAQRSLFGYAITSDGWSNVQNRPLLNVMAVVPGGAEFIHAVDTSGDTKTGEYIADVIAQQLEKMKAADCDLIITDGAANCKAAGRELERRFPHITHMLCTAHCLDLFLEDVGSNGVVKNILDDAKQVVKFITNHQKSLEMYRQHAAAAAVNGVKSKELLKYGETRFATQFYQVERLILQRAALEETVAAREWNAWADKQTYKEEAKTVKRIIQRDAFWEDAEMYIKLTKPVLLLLRLVDSDVPGTVCKVYDRCAAIQESIKKFNGLDADLRDALDECWLDRWNQLHSIYHGAGRMLDPEFLEVGGPVAEEPMNDLMAVVKKFTPEVDVQATIMAQYAQFRLQEGKFAEPMVLVSAKQMSIYKWWMTYGNHVPDLQRIALRVVSKVSSACSCERNWSAFEFIHSKRRNRLTSQRANDLVYVFSNAKLQRGLRAGKEEHVLEWANEANWDGMSDSSDEGEWDSDLCESDEE